MELIKLLILIGCVAVLIFLVLPALVAFFIVRARDPQKLARRAKAGVVILLVAAALLIGVIIWDAIDMFMTLPKQEPQPAENTAQTTAPAEVTEPEKVPETEPVTEPDTVAGATISSEQLDGQWIAIAEPEIPEDSDYSYCTKGGYYEFTAAGEFTYTQVNLYKMGTWAAEDGSVVYTGNYTLSGDILTLHYKTRELRTDEVLIGDIDETDVINMRINQSCTDMCVLTPDHPKLGKLFIFQKGRGTDPINALLIPLNATY